MCSPWMLVWNGDCYFLLGHTDKHGVTPFRGDRIAAPQRVTLLCDNSVMDPIVDRFVEDAVTFPVDGKTFQASVPVTASKPFFVWVFGFDGKVRITAPAKVKREYEKMLQRAIESN